MHADNTRVFVFVFKSHKTQEHRVFLRESYWWAVLGKLDESNISYKKRERENKALWQLN